MTQERAAPVCKPGTRTLSFQSMIAGASRQTVLRLSTLSLVVVATLGLVLSTASLPHTHQPSLPGLYNQEHDLTLLAAVGGIGPLPDAPSVDPIALATLLVVPPISWLPRARPRRTTDYRAPPVR